MTLTNSSRFDEPLPGSQDPLLYSLVYCSRATAGVDQAVVDTIIATAHRRNPLLGITGLLVVGSGLFVQWIEGPKAEVTSLMDQIKMDSRHETIVVLTTSEEVRERIFPAWDMELVDANDIRDVLTDALESTSDKKSIAALMLLLNHLGERDLIGG